MTNLHVLLATADADIASLKTAEAKNTTTAWTAPKKAMPGDKVLFFLWGTGLIAKGVIKTASKLNISGHWAGRYRARVSDVATFEPPFSEEQLVGTAPSWKWLTYPRMYTTPDEEIADALRALILDSEIEPPLDIDLTEGNEGGKRYVYHLVAERSPKIADAKRRAVLKERGALACEVCKFDFRKQYGKRGEGFCEVHHLVPLAQLSEKTPTRLKDLAIVCSNCHRMIHRGNLLTIKALQALFRPIGTS